MARDNVAEPMTVNSNFRFHFLHHPSMCDRTGCSKAVMFSTTNKVYFSLLNFLKVVQAPALVHQAETYKQAQVWSRLSTNRMFLKAKGMSENDVVRICSSGRIGPIHCFLHCFTQGIRSVVQTRRKDFVYIGKKCEKAVSRPMTPRVCKMNACMMPKVDTYKFLDSPWRCV